MRRHRVGLLGYGLLAMAMAVLPLAGCTTLNFAMPGSFGPSTQEVADLPDVGGYTAEKALADARAHFRDNDFGYAAALYKRAVDLAPKDPEGYVGLGASYDRLGRFDLADNAYATLHVITGDTAQYYNNVGYSYMLRGNLTAALASFRKAKALDPSNVVVANNLQLLANAAAAHA